MPMKASAFSIGDIVKVSPAARPEYRDRTGIVTEVGPGESEFRVEFDDGEMPTTAYLAAAWLTPIRK